MESSNRRLMWHGMFLFLLGLLTGFVEHRFANVRMGLAAHLEGVMNGTFLLALGVRALVGPAAQVLGRTRVAGEAERTTALRARTTGSG